MCRDPKCTKGSSCKSRRGVWFDFSKFSNGAEDDSPEDYKDFFATFKPKPKPPSELAAQALKEKLLSASWNQVNPDSSFESDFEDDELSAAPESMDTAETEQQDPELVDVSDSEDEGDEDEEAELESEPSTSKREKMKSKDLPDNRRTQDLDNFLHRLESNLEWVSDLDLEQPYCGKPGCSERCEIHCKDCMGFYCRAHHADENGTHSYMIWREAFTDCKKTVQFPGFQLHDELGRIDTTGSFCLCDDPKPKPKTFTFLHDTAQLQRVECSVCVNCCNLFAILHKYGYLMINSNFVVSLEVLRRLRRTASESMETWVDIIEMANKGKKLSIDNHRLTLAKMCFAQYLKRVKDMGECPMCMNPATRELLVQEFYVELSKNNYGYGRQNINAVWQSRCCISSSKDIL